MRHFFFVSLMSLVAFFSLSSSAFALNHRVPRPQPHVEAQPTHHNAHPARPGGYSSYPGRDHHSVNVCRVMSNDSFHSLLSAVQNAASFDKLGIVKTAASNNNFSADQVARIIKAMTFKSYEEDAAVVLYNAMCDKSEWFKVYDAFTFSASVTEVNSRIHITGNSSHRANSRHCSAMDESSLNALIRTISNAASFDRMEIVKTAAKTSNFTTAQVARIVKAMSFKSYEEDAAVALYPAVCDKNNWFSMANAYSFSHSATEVNRRLGL